MINPKDIKYGVGIDVSQASLEVALSRMDAEAIIRAEGSRRFSNTPGGFKKLMEWLSGHELTPDSSGVILLEATGVYYEQCAFALHQAGWPVSVVLANKAKRYMQALGLRSKTDGIDARGLSHMATSQPLTGWQPLKPFYFHLRGLTRQHQAVQELRTQLGNQKHALSRSIYQVPLVMEQLQQSLEAIEVQLKSLEQAIAIHLASDLRVKQAVDRMCGIKGVGQLSVAVLLAETNGFGLISSARQLISYAGYDVVENQSGQRRGKTRISKKGNGRIRRILHLPALNVVRFQGGLFADLFDRTYARHGIKMKSYVAVQKKLLVILYTLWKSEQSFDPAFRTPQNEENQKQEVCTEHPTQVQSVHTKTAFGTKPKAAEGRRESKTIPQTPVKPKPKISRT